MKSLLLLLTFCSVVVCSSVQAKDSITPALSERFGEVFEATIEFVEKPRTYYAQNFVKVKWYAKVTAVNGKALKEPVVMEYRCGDLKFKKGSTVTLRAYEDIETFGQNREWDGVVRQYEYSISHFLRVREIPKSKDAAGKSAKSKTEEGKKPKSKTKGSRK